jgi:hypothetical protein
MTAQTETAILIQRTSKWQAFLVWLDAIDEGINYDPHEHTLAVARNLSRKVELLETRVKELEAPIRPSARAKTIVAPEISKKGSDHG